MAQLPLEQGIPRFKANEERINTMTNGDEDATWTTSDGAEVPSIRKLFKEINTEGDGWLALAESEADRAEAAADRIDLGALDAAVQATGEDRIQTGLDRAQTGLDVIASASSADRAETARDAAYVSANVYADTAAGLAATTGGDQFQVVRGDEIIRYRHDTGTVAVEVARYPNADALMVSERYALDASYVATADYFVNPQTGSDLNDGTTPTTAFATLEQARATAGAGDTVCVTRGQNYPVVPPVTMTESIASTGTAADMAVLDGRQSLIGKTWTDEGGGVWKTTITLSGATVSGGLGSNTTCFGLWLKEAFGEWKVGGVDIAANITEVASVPLGTLAFAINRTGSTVQDIRSDIASTGPFDLYVKMPDGLSPNGRDVKCSDRPAVLITSGDCEFRGVRLIGGFGKDHLSFDQSAVSTLIGCEILDFGEHGSVGPANVTDHLAIGKARPSATVGADRNRSAGAALNLYSAAYQSTLDLTINGLTVKDCDKGIYCHGSGNQGYRSLTISGRAFRVTNARHAMWIDPVPSTLLPMFVQGIYCDAPVTFDEVDFAFGVDGYWEIVGGGVINLSSNPLTNACTIAALRGATSYLLLKDIELCGKVANSFSYRNLLYNRSSTSGFGAPTLVLDNVRDVSPIGSRLLGPRSTETAEAVNLVLTGETQLQNLAFDASHTGDWPASLTVTDGCTFGWGDRTGPDIVSALNALSIPNNISNQTTILNIDGSVASAPGW